MKNFLFMCLLALAIGISFELTQSTSYFEHRAELAKIDTLVIYAPMAKKVVIDDNATYDACKVMPRKLDIDTFAYFPNVHHQCYTDEDNGVPPLSISKSQVGGLERASQKIPILKAQVGDGDTTIPTDWRDFLALYWVKLFWGLFAFVELVVRLTPTEADNSLVNRIKLFLDVLIPNRKIDSGEH